MLLTEFDEKDYIEGVREEGERKGREEGRNKMIYSLVEDKSISMEKGAEKLGISVEKLKADMINAGYKCLEWNSVNKADELHVFLQENGSDQRSKAC